MYVQLSALLRCSTAVRPRKPDGRDDAIDYEVDSEEEWEEEPEDGEQLSVRHLRHRVAVKLALACKTFKAAAREDETQDGKPQTVCHNCESVHVRVFQEGLSACQAL